VGEASRRLRELLAVTLAGLTGGLVPSAALANPSGGVVVGGGATIAGQGTNTVTINQTTNSAVLSWQKFNIAQGESTNFVQPGAQSIALNRILDGQASSILGNLNANGHVYLINPNGILFGQSAVVNVGGLAAATNAQVTGLIDAQTSALASAQGAAGASITNQGQINVAPGGDVYLVGAKVENSATGAIHVEGGVVKVASGATLVLAGEDGIAVEYQVPTTPDNTAVNLGTIIADKGIVDIRASIVRQDGTVQASRAVEHEGQIILTGDTEVHVDGDTAADNGDVQVQSGGDVVIGAGGNLRSQSGDVNVQSGHDVLFTSTDQNNDSVIETGSGNIQVVAQHDVNLQPDANAAGNTAIRTRGVDVAQADGSVIHEKGDGGNVVVVAETGNVNAGSGDRWIDTVPPLDPVFFQLFGVDYPSKFDPIPVDPRGILGIGSEAGGNVTVIAGGNVSTRSGDPSVVRTEGTATGAPPSSLNPLPPTTYDGSHIGVFGQAYQTVEFPSGLFSVDSVRVPIADAPKAKLTVISGGDIAGDYMIRNGTATLRAGYSLDQSALGQIEADPSALQAIEASADPATRAQIHLSDGATADPTVGWLGSLRSPLTVDLAFASVDGRGANGIALRAAENPSLVYPQSSKSAVGTAKIPLYDETDSLTLDAERGDIVLLGNEDVIPEAGNALAASSPNPYVHELPPNVTLTTHDFTRGDESRGGDLVLLNDFTMLPSQQGGLNVDVAGQVRTATVAAAGNATVPIDLESSGASADQTFTLLAGLKLRDPTTGAEYILDSTVTMQQKFPQQPALGAVKFTLTPQALASGVTIPAGTKVITRSGKIFTTQTDLVVPPAAQRPRQTQVVFTLDHPAKTVIGLSSNQVHLVGPDGVVYSLDKDVQINPGQSRIQVGVTAQIGGGPDLVPGQLHLQTPIDGIQATNSTVSSRPATTTILAQSVLPGTEGSILAHEIVGLATPVPGVVSATNSGAILGRDEAQFGQPQTAGTPVTITATNVVGPAGVPANGTQLQIESGQSLPPGVSIGDLEVAAGAPESATHDSLLPAVFRDLKVVHDDAGNVISTEVDAPRGQLNVLDPASIWTTSLSSPNSGLRLAPTGQIIQSKASPDIDGRSGTLPSGGVFNYANYYAQCKSGAVCQMEDPQTGSSTLLRGSGPTHQNNSAPALILAKGGFDRVGFDLAEAATAWSGADSVDLTLKTQQTSPTDLTQLVVPYGNATFGATTETLVDDQLGVPIKVLLPADPASGLNVSGPGQARVLVGVAPHVDPIQGFEGPLAPLVPAPVDPENHGIALASWQGSTDSFTGLDERGKVSGTGDGLLFKDEAPWVPIDKTGKTGNLELNDVGGESSLGLLTSGNGTNPALPRGGATLEVITAGDILVHRFGAVGTVQGGDLTVQSVTGKIVADLPPDTYKRERGFFTLNAEQSGSTAVNEATGGGKISIDSSGDFDAGGSAVATLSSSNIRIETRRGSIIAGHGSAFSAPTVAFDVVTGTPTINYAGAGLFASGTGNITLVAHHDINIGAGIRARGIQLNAGGNVTAGSGSVSGGTISIDAGGTISGSFSASSISIGSGTLSSGATVSAGVVSGAGGTVSNTSANQVSASAIVASTAQNSNIVSETAAGQAQSGLRGVIIDVSSRPCEKDECR